jgi:hypothetical protein
MKRGVSRPLPLREGSCGSNQSSSRNNLGAIPYPNSSSARRTSKRRVSVAPTRRFAANPQISRDVLGCGCFRLIILVVAQHLRMNQFACERADEDFHRTEAQAACRKYATDASEMCVAGESHTPWRNTTTLSATSRISSSSLETTMTHRPSSASRRTIA